MKINVSGILLSVLALLGLFGCEQQNNKPQVTKDPMVKTENKDVVITGFIKPKNRNIPFVEVPAKVTLEEMNRGGDHKVLASTIVKASYDTGFLAQYTLDYNQAQLNKKSKYFVRVEAKEGSTLLWHNNILASGVKNPFEDSQINITIQ
ncbi:hypothetical protein [Vibrio sp. NTOU-M3]|uniref:hypothetical protein n=1 Tax=unclassified Vibrio TaxID=2614977 RepID=UPI00349FB45A